MISNPLRYSLSHSASLICLIMVTLLLSGFAEWLRPPVTGSISINNATAWRLYDSDFKQKASDAGNGSALLPGSGAAAYLMMFGASGSTIHLNLVQ